MALPSIESVTLGYKMANLAWDVAKAVRNSAQAAWRRTPYRSISSLTTIEFVQEGNRQLTYFVQDRTTLFMKKDIPLPGFLYGTDGTDNYDDQIVDNVSRGLMKEDSTAGRVIGPTPRILYSKGETARAVLLAHSVDGFLKRDEYYDHHILGWVDFSTLAIIFPPERKPENLEVRYQAPGDAPSDWRPVRREKYEVRHTTKGRLAFAWEATNPRVGNVYRISWRW